MRQGLSLLASIAVLAACAPMGIAQPGMSESAALHSMGEPAMQFALPEGARQLVFPTGPLGTQTYMVYVRNGTVERSEQVLKEDVFMRIRAGDTREDVQRLIGPPNRVIRFENLRQDAWDYRFIDAWGYLSEFSAMIDDQGRVAGKVSVRLNPGKDHD